MNRLIGSRVGRSAIGGWLPGCCFFLLVGALTLPFFLVISFLVLPCVQKKKRIFLFCFFFFVRYSCWQSWNRRQRLPWPGGTSSGGISWHSIRHRQTTHCCRPGTVNWIVINRRRRRKKKEAKSEWKKKHDRERAAKKIKRESVWLWFFLSVLHLCYIYIYK